MIFSYFVGIFCFSVLKSHISVLCKVGGGFNDRCTKIYCTHIAFKGNVVF
nr:MAG TPA: hypothetical protein [Caudoviricetes sp.]DAQ26552.1 MAG TPA: hypothetical protein [Caudoviricetes sp.]DAY53586.1 MAG TPA: hypothetical protein [Caudoviricetes sp.]